MEYIASLVLVILAHISTIITTVDIVPASEVSVNDPEIATVLRVVDGDTIDVLMAGKEERVRYIGIDTPEPYREERSECYAHEASEANTSLVADQTVTLVSDVENRDQYNRLLRYVYVDDLFVNESLVRSGYATVLPIKPNTTFAAKFAAAEIQAREDTLGLWLACK